MPEHDWTLDCPEGGFPPPAYPRGSHLRNTPSGPVANRYGWVAVPVQVYVQVDFATGHVDRMHLRPEEDGSVLPLGPREAVADALLDWAEGDGMDEVEASEALRIVNEGGWAVLRDLPTTVKWEG